MRDGQGGPCHKGRSGGPWSQGKVRGALARLTIVLMLTNMLKYTNHTML